VRRAIGTAAAIVALALSGCGREETAKGPVEVPVTPAGQEDAYQTAVFAQQRAEWQVHAEQGDSRAQRELGMMYYLGQGMDVDYATAYDWLNKAALQGDDVAQMTVGVMYAEGQGVPQSRVQAHLWFSLSAQQGNSSAQYRLERLAPQMTADEVAEAQRLAQDWKPTI
jgi:hypothetical protein